MATCPSCNGEFTFENQRGVSVAVCEKCDGIWLGAGDLDRLSGEALEAEFDSWMSPPTECRYCNKPLGFSDTCAHCGRLPTIQCPAGHGVMDAAIVEVADREFEIDRCASCRGVWVDGHEREHVDAVDGPPVRKLPTIAHQSGGRSSRASFLQRLEGDTGTSGTLEYNHYRGWRYRPGSGSGLFGLLLFMILPLLAFASECGIAL